MGRKLAGMGEHDNVAFLLTTIVQSAVIDSGSNKGPDLNVSNHPNLAETGEVEELLAAYEKHVLPQLAKSLFILRKMMGFGTARCKPLLDRTEIRMVDQEIERKAAVQAAEMVSKSDSAAFFSGQKLRKY